MSTVLFDPIKTQSKITDEIIVAFSGGKDSIVVLDLCFRYFKKVRPFFMYIVPDLSFEERTLEWYERKYQTEITRIPHMETSNWFRYGVFSRPDDDISIISINDIYHYMRIKEDMWWIAAGERRADSMVRNAMIKHSGSIDTKRGRIYPIVEWKKQDVLAYIKYHNLYLGRDSKLLGFSFRSLQGRELAKIKQEFPDDYKKILRIYPFAEAAVLNEEINQNGKNKISGI